jgi:hypothetical protein
VASDGRKRRSHTSCTRWRKEVNRQSQRSAASNGGKR